MRVAHVLLGVACALALTTASDARSRDSTRPTVTQVMDYYDAEIARVKASLQLNAEQDKNWGAFQTALHDMAAARTKARLDRQQEAATPPSTPAPPATTTPPAASTPPAAGTPPATTTPPATPAASTGTPNTEDDGALAELRAQADLHAEKADNLRKLVDALQPLYVSLDARQRRVALQFLHRYWVAMYANAGE